MFVPTESSCPFCGAAVVLTAASTVSLPLAFVAGLSLLACTDKEDEAGDDLTSDPTSETVSTAGDGDGDTQETTDYTDYGGSEYGGPPPCDELASAIPLALGSNPIDTAMSGDDFVTMCGDQQGTGPDSILQFSSPAAGVFSFAVSGASFDAWLLQFGFYCEPYASDLCAPNQALDIELFEGQTLYLIVDGAAGGAASIDVTQE